VFKDDELDVTHPTPEIHLDWIYKMICHLESANTFAHPRKSKLSQAVIHPFYDHQCSFSHDV